MMINKRLIGTVSKSKKYIVGNVVAHWLSLAANIAMMTVLTSLLASLFTRTADEDSMLLTAAAAVVVRFLHGYGKPYEFSFIKNCQKDVAGKNIPKAPVPWSIL